MHFIKKIVFSFLKISTLFYNKKIVNKIKYTLDKIYTFWLLQDLKSDNTQIYIERQSSFSGLENITIGMNSYIHRYCRIEAIKSYGKQIFMPEIIIGRNVNIGEYNHITAINKIIIGDGVLTGRRVTISDNNHGSFEREYLDDIPTERKITSKGDVIIGKNVWIGENVCILSGVTIGKGCVIAANAVVTKNIPDYSLVAGVPARVIKQFNS